jgi:acyl carrier protein
VSADSGSEPKAPPRARDLLGEIDPAAVALLTGVDADASLLDAGLDSAQLIELALLLEELLGTPLAAAELDRLSTLASIDALLAERLGSA